MYDRCQSLPKKICRW